jgi:hypothetical protein
VDLVKIMIEISATYLDKQCLNDERSFEEKYYFKIYFQTCLRTFQKQNVADQEFI